MELVFRSAAAALCAAMLALLLKRTNPELSLLVSLAAVAVILLAAMKVAQGIRSFSELLRSDFGLSDTLLLPVLKCLAIGLTSRIASDLCKDSSQAATASSVEFAGTVCALSVIMPLVMSVLRLIGGLV